MNDTNLITAIEPYDTSDALGKALVRWEWEHMTEAEREAKAAEISVALATFTEAVRPIAEAVGTFITQFAESLAASPLAQWMMRYNADQQYPDAPAISTMRIVAHKPRTKVIHT